MKQYILFSCLFISILLFYLNNYKLSNIKLISYIQILSLLSILIYIYYGLFDILNNINIVYYINDKNDVNLHGHVSLDKESAKEISKGIGNLGTNIGLAGTVTGVAGAVAKGVSKSSMPPFQKAGLIAAAAGLGGVIHTGASVINRSLNNSNSSSNSNSNSLQTGSNNGGNNTSNFMDTFDNLSPVEIVLYCINVLSDISIYLIIILCLQLFYKFFVSDKPELRFVNLILSDSLSTKLKALLYKIIKLNKNMSVIWIVFIIILLLISSSAISYFSWQLINNLDLFVSEYNQLKKK